MSYSAVPTRTTNDANSAADINQLQENIENGRYQIDDVFVQWPIAASNTIATAFPTAQRPATRFGGTWEQIWNTDAIFFRTEGNFHASDAQNTNRTNGKQTHQAQAHYHTSKYRLAGPDSLGGSGISIYSVATGSNTEFAEGMANDGTHGAILSGYENRPQNRIFLLWKRTA